MSMKLASDSDVDEWIPDADGAFLALWASLPFGAAVVDDDGHILMANDILCSWLGHEPTALRGQTVLSLFPARLQAHVLARLQRCQQAPAGQPGEVDDDLWVVPAQGGELDASMALSRLHFAQRELSLVVLSDLRERKRLEFNLKQANADLQEFTYVASHDLRSPLRGMADLLDWIAEDVTAGHMDDVAKNLARATLRVHRMEMLIDDLLQYARAGRTESRSETVTMTDVLENILAMDPVAECFRIETEFEVTRFQAQRTPLETVLRNLIRNAVKHHDRDHGCIRVRTAMDGDFVLLSVSDDGPGIPEMAFQRIFRLFQTLAGAKRGSSGIGLAVCKRLIEVQGGRIDVCSPIEDARGTLFRVWWPAFARR